MKENYLHTIIEKEVKEIDELKKALSHELYYSRSIGAFVGKHIIEELPENITEHFDMSLTMNRGYHSDFTEFVLIPKEVSNSFEAFIEKLKSDDPVNFNRRHGDKLSYNHLMNHDAFQKMPKVFLVINVPNIQDCLWRYSWKNREEGLNNILQNKDGDYPCEIYFKTVGQTSENFGWTPRLNTVGFKAMSELDMDEFKSFAIGCQLQFMDKETELSLQRENLIKPIEDEYKEKTEKFFEDLTNKLREGVTFIEKDEVGDYDWSSSRAWYKTGGESNNDRIYYFANVKIGKKTTIGRFDKKVKLIGDIRKTDNRYWCGDDFDLKTSTVQLREIYNWLDINPPTNPDWVSRY